jgi:hypothetical protein
MLIALLLGDFNTPWVQYVVLAVLGIMLVSACCYGEEYFKLAVAAPAYISLLPFYINVLAVFAACKTDDISWGTRGTEESNTEKSFSRLKTWYLLFFIVCNLAFGMGFENVNRSSNEGSSNSWSGWATYALIVLYSIAMGILVFPFLSLLLYLSLRACRACRRHNAEKRRVQFAGIRAIREMYMGENPNFGMKRALRDLLPPRLSENDIIIRYRGEDQQIGIINRA